MCVSMNFWTLSITASDKLDIVIVFPRERYNTFSKLDGSKVMESFFHFQQKNWREKVIKFETSKN